MPENGQRTQEQMMSPPTPLPPAIGGYFGLELPQGKGEYHRDAWRYPSARAAFLALLRAAPPSAIWMPWYLCDSMLEPPAIARVPLHRYRLDEQLRILDAQPGANDWLLYVNYFGICERNIEDALKRFNPHQVIIDNSQAFFSRPANCLATLYSPRKFFGVPDGGYLVTQLDMPSAQSTADDEDSVAHCQHLLQRLGGEPENGFASFAASEASLAHRTDRRMSRLTQALLNSIDYEAIRTQRSLNFAALHTRLAAHNRFPAVQHAPDGPLCYPFLPDNDCPPAALHAQRIYAPCYWPEMAALKDVAAFESALAQKTLFLPCDQRMAPEATERLLHVVTEACHLPEGPLA